MKRNKFSWIKKLLIGLSIFVLALSVLPFGIPLSKAQAVEKPYENSRFFSVEGSDVHYQVFQPTTASYKGALLMVHGLGGSTFSYQENAPTLAEAGYFVVAVDLPGFGYSSRQTDEDHSQVHRAKILWQLLDSVLDGNPNWHLLGHSMGGGTVAAMALERPSRTTSLVFVDGALFQTNRDSTFLTDFPVSRRWIQILLEHLLIRENRFKDFLGSAYGQEPTPVQVQGYLKPLQLKGTARAAVALLKTAKNLPEEALKTITAPTLALWGKEDSWVPFSDTQRLKTLMPQLQIVNIENAGHCPMETHPEQFNKILLNWLENRNE